MPALLTSTSTPPQACDDRGDRRVHLRLVGDVDRDRHGRAPLALELGGGGLGGAAC